MVTKQVVVGGDVLRSQKAGEFVDKMSCFKSSVYLEQGSRRINAKSIIGVLSMNLNDGDDVSILVNGEDEQLAMNAANNYIVKRIED